MPVQLALAELSAGDDCRAEITEAREIAEVHILTQSKEKLGGKAPIMKPARGTCARTVVPQFRACLESKELN